MTSRVFRYRQANITRDSVWTLTPTTGSEVATRVIINAIHIKMASAANSSQWVNFYMHLNLIPNGITVDPNQSPGYTTNLYNKMSVASCTIHTLGGNGNLFSLPQLLTFRGSDTKSNDLSDTQNPIWLISSYSDSLRGGSDFSERTEKVTLSGSGYLGGGNYHIRWDIPQHFYMSPGDSLQLIYGGYYSSSAQQITDVNTNYFLGANVDFICVAESN